MRSSIPLTDARRRLPRPVRQVRRDRGEAYTITVRDEAVAELRAAPPGPEPGLAARKLLEIMARLPKPKARARGNVGARTKEHLYGKGGAIK